MDNFYTRLKVDTQKITLSSESSTLKTESFIGKTKYLCDIDFFVSKIAESITREYSRLFEQLKKTGKDSFTSFKIKAEDGSFSFMIKFGFQVQNLQPKDIVFYDFLHAGDSIRQNDQRIKQYLTRHKIINFTLTPTKDITDKSEFSKQYLLSNGYLVDFPKLNKEQFNLISIENKNTIIEGVAGSGKTNVCIDKLIYVACKNYGGRVLYTTYSRGLIVDTKFKIEIFKKNLLDFIKAYDEKRVIFLDDNHKKALENKLGIFFFSDDDEQIIKKIKRIVEFLSNKVDFFLLSDLYEKYYGKVSVVGENYFVSTYIKGIKNHQLSSKLNKIKSLSFEVIYKEIFGLIYGINSETVISFDDYFELRKNSYDITTCKTIYTIALDYKRHLEEKNLFDNNLLSRKLLNDLDRVENYSLTIIDEVQDFTQISLNLFKKISLKLFCAGDALQMINPSYFSFGYLKNLLYEKDVADVVELKNNYRNSKKIQQIINDLDKVNMNLFGTHNFVIQGKSVDSEAKTNAVYINDQTVIKRLSNNKLDNFTVVVDTLEQKNKLRNYLKNQEILTVSEIKGLERNTVLLYNLLSDNLDKWQYLNRIVLNKKKADENSVYRYYFNLFYVGISRAKQNLFILEDKTINNFLELFNSDFEKYSGESAIKKLESIVSKIEFTEEEKIERVKEFIKAEQYDNARFIAEKITDDALRIKELQVIDIFEKKVQQGDYRGAGIQFWEIGLIDEAKKQFVLSGDQTLIDLIDAVSQNNESKLNIDIVKYYDDVRNNEVARKFILDTIGKDIKQLKDGQREIHSRFKGDNKN